MIVIADNSSLSALAEIGELEVLNRLYGKITIPSAVAIEANHTKAPEALREWIAAHPPWLQIASEPVPLLPEVASLGAGEAAAISLAWEYRTNALLFLADLAARRLAHALGLQFTGVGGILVAAARLGYLDFDTALDRLQNTSFHLGVSVVEGLRKRWRSG